MSAYTSVWVIICIRWHTLVRYATMWQGLYVLLIFVFFCFLFCYPKRVWENELTWLDLTWLGCPHEDHILSCLSPQSPSCNTFGRGASCQFQGSVTIVHHCLLFSWCTAVINLTNILRPWTKVSSSGRMLKYYTHDSNNKGFLMVYRELTFFSPNNTLSFLQ